MPRCYFQCQAREICGSRLQFIFKLPSSIRRYTYYIGIHLSGTSLNPYVSAIYGPILLKFNWMFFLVLHGAKRKENTLRAKTMALEFSCIINSPSSIWNKFNSAIYDCFNRFKNFFRFLKRFANVYWKCFQNNFYKFSEVTSSNRYKNITIVTIKFIKFCNHLIY